MIRFNMFKTDTLKLFLNEYKCKFFDLTKYILLIVFYYHVAKTYNKKSYFYFLIRNILK